MLSCVGQMLIDVRCQFCKKLLLQMSHDSTGIQRVKCRHCKKLNDLNLALVLKPLKSDTVRPTFTLTK